MEPNRRTRGNPGTEIRPGMFITGYSRTRLPRPFSVFVPNGRNGLNAFRIPDAEIDRTPDGYSTFEADGVECYACPHPAIPDAYMLSTSAGWTCQAGIYGSAEEALSGYEALLGKYASPGNPDTERILAEAELEFACAGWLRRR